METINIYNEKLAKYSGKELAILLKVKYTINDSLAVIEILTEMNLRYTKSYVDELMNLAKKK